MASYNDKSIALPKKGRSHYRVAVKVEESHNKMTTKGTGGRERLAHGTHAPRPAHHNQQRYVQSTEDTPGHRYTFAIKPSTHSFLACCEQKRVGEHNNINQFVVKRRRPSGNNRHQRLLLGAKPCRFNLKLRSTTVVAKQEYKNASSHERQTADCEPHQPIRP